MKIETIDIRIDNDDQILRIPKEFAIDDNKVYLKKTGNVISIIPFHNPWQNFYESLSLFTPDFMENRNEPSQPLRDMLD